MELVLDWLQCLWRAGGLTLGLSSLLLPRNKTLTANLAGLLAKGCIDPPSSATASFHSSLWNSRLVRSTRARGQVEGPRCRNACTRRLYFQPWKMLRGHQPPLPPWFLRHCICAAHMWICITYMQHGKIWAKDASSMQASFMRGKCVHCITDL